MWETIPFIAPWAQAARGIPEAYESMQRVRRGESPDAWTAQQQKGWNAASSSPEGVAAFDRQGNPDPTIEDIMALLQLLPIAGAGMRGAKAGINAIAPGQLGAIRYRGPMAGVSMDEIRAMPNAVNPTAAATKSPLPGGPPPLREPPYRRQLPVIESSSGTPLPTPRKNIYDSNWQAPPPKPSQITVPMSPELEALLAEIEGPRPNVSPGGGLGQRSSIGPQGAPTQGSYASIPGEWGRAFAEMAPDWMPGLSRLGLLAGGGGVLAMLGDLINGRAGRQYDAESAALQQQNNTPVEVPFSWPKTPERQMPQNSIQSYLDEMMAKASISARAYESANEQPLPDSYGSGSAGRNPFKRNQATNRTPPPSLQSWWSPEEEAHLNSLLREAGMQTR